jgi:hypothetical protein
MSASLAACLAVGMAVGIALIVLFAMNAKPEVSLVLSVKVDMLGKTSSEAVCEGPMSALHVSENVPEFIKTTDCIWEQGFENASES